MAALEKIPVLNPLKKVLEVSRVVIAFAIIYLFLFVNKWLFLS